MDPFFTPQFETKYEPLEAFEMATKLAAQLVDNVFVAQVQVRQDRHMVSVGVTPAHFTEDYLPINIFDAMRSIEEAFGSLDIDTEMAFETPRIVTDQYTAEIVFDLVYRTYKDGCICGQCGLDEDDE